MTVNQLEAIEQWDFLGTQPIYSIGDCFNRCSVCLAIRSSLRLAISRKRGLFLGLQQPAEERVMTNTARE